MPAPNEPVGPIPDQEQNAALALPQPTDVNPLLRSHHTALLATSGISPTVIQARGYFTANSREQLAEFKFSPKCPFPALVYPIFDLDGKKCLYQARPDQPRKNKAGKSAKYELPKDSKRKIDVPPGARDGVLDAARPLFITIGVRQADAAVSKGLTCLALLDVWGWLRQVLFWNRVPLERREVFIVFDSETCTNVTKQASAFRLKEFLQGRLAHVQFIVLPGDDAGSRVTLDDFLASGRGVEALLQWATTELPFTMVKAVGAESPNWYRCTPAGLFLNRVDKEGEVTPVPLRNFPARILAQLGVTDDVNTHLEVEIEATVGGQTKRVEVRAEKFTTMSWVDEELGPEAIILPGPWMKEHTRTAMQALSIPIPRVTVYESLGWVIHEGKRLFRHAGGFIGADPEPDASEKSEDRCRANELLEKTLGTPAPNIPILRNDRRPKPIRMRPPEGLAGFVLPEPPAGPQLITAIRASLKVLEVAPARYIAPLYVAPWRAPLGPADYSLYAVGKTGNMKSESVALIQQHLGPGLNRKNLPANWESTANAILSFMHQAKDVLVSIDDWLARGSKSDIERKNRDADMVLRSQGNLSGRARCNRDGVVKAGKRPRCFTIITGEDTPEGSSLNARFLALELAEHEVNRAKLTHVKKTQQRGSMHKRQPDTFVG